MTTSRGRKSLLRLHRIGEAYGKLPSAIAGIEDEWAAFQFDSAALALGRAIDSALAENDRLKKGQRRKPEDVVTEILSGKPAQPSVKAPPKNNLRTIRPGDPEWDEWKMFVNPPSPSHPEPV